MQKRLTKNSIIFSMYSNFSGGSWTPSIFTGIQYTIQLLPGGNFNFFSHRILVPLSSFQNGHQFGFQNAGNIRICLSLYYLAHSDSARTFNSKPNHLCISWISIVSSNDDNCR